MCCEHSSLSEYLGGGVVRITRESAPSVGNSVVKVTYKNPSFSAKEEILYVTVYDDYDADYHVL
jgi:hypothetical protein